MQGFNMGRYVPPDKEGLISGNKLHRKPTTPPTIRFEMPFAVWCLTCCPDPQSTAPNTPRPVIIGQGVRFNAVKKKVGMYYTSTIWSFTMKHNVCGGELEIRTDPKNTAYVCFAGCRQRDQGSEEVLRGRDGGVEAGKEILTDAERERLRKDAFGRLERTIEDREQLKAAKGRIEELEGRSERDWGDDYGRNQALRRVFRVGRKERERVAKGDEELKERIGWGEEMMLEGEREEDGLRAGLVEFRPVGDDDDEKERNRTLAKPLFGGTKGNMERKGLLKEEKVVEKRKGEFREAVMGNTRVGMDPFLNEGEGRRGLEKRILGVKRKREVVGNEEVGEAEVKEAVKETKKVAVGGLVDYESDSN